MDITIRKHETCVIGLPRCDYVFSSTRTCFIAYGFDESTLEMSLLSKLLEERGIQAIEAGGNLAPAQNAYCAKICSKIITAQFCIALLNNEEKDGVEIPSPNVHMEYGLMLGFNKYVIPFQRASQKLPFNVAGLDTIKYGSRDFERQAAEAIDQAIVATTQKTPSAVPVDQLLSSFLLTKRALVASLADQGEKNLYELGRPLGFSFLNDFSGMRGIYFGNFTSLRPDAVLWRLKTLESILAERVGSLELRVRAGLVPAEQLEFLTRTINALEMWILVTSDDDRNAVLAESKSVCGGRPFDVFSISDVHNALANSGLSSG